MHDWLTGMRGGEWCLDVFCELLPGATIFTLLHLPGRVSKRIESMEIRTTFIERLPGARAFHQRYLPLFPAAVDRLDLSGFDFVLSSSHCVAKGAEAPDGRRHVCYCHTPMRYIWEFYEDYFANPRTGTLTRLVMPLVASYLRRWDVRTASRVDRFVANSAHIAARIRKAYGREAEVVHPPVDVSRFRADLPRGEYFLVLSALVPYKRVELAVRAFSRLNLPLVVAGRGPERTHLERIAGPNIRFEGWLGESEVADLLARARALVFPGVEDFGIVPLEAMASGCPVIAFRAGGALETVVERGAEGGAVPTGLFFDRHDAESLAEAVRKFRPDDYDPWKLRAHATRFDRSLFLEKILGLLREEESMLG
ncbi:MAG: glycosyltransferase [Candidatus Eisenbacteria bacterium]